LERKLLHGGGRPGALIVAQATRKYFREGKTIMKYGTVSRLRGG
jgi:hypothetical protein